MYVFRWVLKNPTVITPYLLIFLYVPFPIDGIGFVVLIVLGSISSIPPQNSLAITKSLSLNVCK